LHLLKNALKGTFARKAPHYQLVFAFLATIVHQAHLILNRFLLVHFPKRALLCQLSAFQEAMQLLLGQANVCHVRQATVVEVMVYLFLAFATTAHIEASQIRSLANRVLQQPTCHSEEELIFLSAYPFLQVEFLEIKV
jgi:hypothetical protein